jgi:hypothetical protein
MATGAQIFQVQKNVPVSGVTDDEVAVMIDAHGVYMTSSLLWEFKAATYAEMVTMNESGSSRNLSDLHKQALAMVAYFASRASEENENPTGGKPAGRVNYIVRP